MTPSPEASRRLGVDTGQRFRQLLRATRRRLHMAVWFPHGPLFIAVACLGLALLRHGLGVGLLGGVSTHNLLALSSGTVRAVLAGAPSAVIGVFLIVMGFGLLTRSRLAWVIALIAAAASFVVILLVWQGGSTTNRGLLTYNGFVLATLLIFSRWFNRSSLASATLFAVISIVSLLVYAVLGSYLLGADFAPPIRDLISALYYAMVTMSTVGYGDIVPKTNEARMFAISVIVLGITVFATSLSALLMPVINRRMETLLKSREKHVSRANHYIIVSDSSLARNTYKELKARDHAVTVILAQPPAVSTDGHDVLVGDASDIEVLRQADAPAARAVLALSADDSENAFVVMAAKELSSEVKTVAVVNDARNMARVKRVRPDLIIAPQVLGGELLAMALSGEAVDSEQILGQLLHFSA